MPYNEDGHYTGEVLLAVMRPSNGQDVNLYEPRYIDRHNGEALVKAGVGRAERLNAAASLWWAVFIDSAGRDRNVPFGTRVALLRWLAEDPTRIEAAVTLDLEAGVRELLAGLRPDA